MSAHLCPQCSGPRIVGHPGLFVWRHAQGCLLLLREDARQAADFEAFARAGDRPITETERTLLAVCGIEQPVEARTFVDYAGIVRQRWWLNSTGERIWIDARDELMRGTRFAGSDEEATT